MARVSHWTFNQSVAHYATNIQQQVLLGPWAEYGILHLQILSGDTDRFANLVQWAAFIGSLVSVSLITQRLAGGVVAQCFSALLVATTPMVILQASSTQNDLVCGFWISCIALFLISYGRGERSRVDLAFIGMTLGIAMLTKPTVYFFAFPFFVLLLVGVCFTDPDIAVADVLSVLLELEAPGGGADHRRRAPFRTGPHPGPSLPGTPSPSPMRDPATVGFLTSG